MFEKENLTQKKTCLIFLKKKYFGIDPDMGLKMSHIRDWCFELSRIWDWGFKKPEYGTGVY